MSTQPKMAPFQKNIRLAPAIFSLLLQTLYHSPLNDSLGANYQLAVTKRF